MDGRMLRTTIAGAIAYVKSVEQNRTTSAITLDHLLGEHVTSIREAKVPRLDKLESDLEACIKAIEDAGTDEGKLKMLGVYEADESDRPDDEQSVSTEGRSA